MVNIFMLFDFILIMIDVERFYVLFIFGRGLKYIVILYDDYYYDIVNLLFVLYGIDEFCYVCYKFYGK